MFAGERFLVIGSGLSGQGAMDFLARAGAKAVCCNSNEKLPPRVAEQVEKVVISPGVPMDAPMVRHLREMGIPVIGEMELAFSAERGRVIAITGTNGKTTTTTLVGEIMKAHFGEDRTFVVGNIGMPYTLKVQKTAKDTVTVAEISSFQLESIDTFRPCVSAVLNITPDHLDRHHTMAAYKAAKERIMKNQTQEQHCVLNYDNEATRDMLCRCPAKPLCFSVEQELWNGYFLRGGMIAKSEEGRVTELLNTRRDMKLKGRCNAENVMAAIAVADAMKVPWETTLGVIRGFAPVEHRIEYVETVAGVVYYNDSKATNPDAAIQGIRAMDRPTVLIAGGYDKESSYDDWVGSFQGKVKWLVLMGQTRERIAECAEEHGIRNIRFADTWEEAFFLGTQLAEEGDAVLLSPACASFGMFQNYEERGRRFKEYVRRIYGSTEKQKA